MSANAQMWEYQPGAILFGEEVHNVEYSSSFDTYDYVVIKGLNGEVIWEGWAEESVTKVLGFDDEHD